MRPLLLAVGLLCSLAVPAGAQGGFFGGLSDGMRDAQERRALRRAIELDRRQGTNTYDEERRDQQMRRLQRSIDEANRKLRDWDYYGRPSSR